MQSELLGFSHKNLPIWVHQFSSKSPRNKAVLVLAGVHGNEIEGLIAANALIGSFAKNFDFDLKFYVLPCLNPDGFFSGSRLNARGVDLNRNLPTKDWRKEAFSPKYPPGDYPNSEIENQILISFIEKIKPGLILSIHSFEKYMMNINGACRDIAEAMQKINSYPIEESIGYPTPGCLGTYCGLERDIPTITYEIQRGLSFDAILEIHLPSFLAGFRVYEGKNL